MRVNVALTAISGPTSVVTTAARTDDGRNHFERAGLTPYRDASTMMIIIITLFAKELKKTRSLVNVARALPLSPPPPPPGSKFARITYFVLAQKTASFLMSFLRS